MLIYFNLLLSANVATLGLEPKGKMDDSVKNISEYTDINMLLAVQVILPKVDSKDFVDRPTKKPLHKVKEEFRKIEKKLGLVNLYDFNINSPEKMLLVNLDKIVGANVHQEDEYTYDILSLREKHSDKIGLLKKFLDENFLEVGSDIEPHTPEDWSKNPDFLKDIKNDDIKETAMALNHKWKELSRKSVEFKKGESTTLLDLPHPFIIPGGRFREYYYWDTYWILEGLLVCGMDKSAENIIKNFIAVIDKYGYIPNGLRKYYLYRSHPPLFPSMLLKLYGYKDGKFNDLILDKGLEMALKEYDFFMKYRSIEINDYYGTKHKLNYYHVKSDFPRPESFGEDVITYKNQTKKSATEIFSNLKTGAETGWDFSSRWLKKVTDLRTINASNLIQVDLNAIMYRNEKIIAKLLKDKGKKKLSEKFEKKAEKRKEAINSILWNKNAKTWMDYDYKNDSFVEHRFYFSNIFPLIFGIDPPENVSPYSILKKYHVELFSYPGGIPASGKGKETYQQWDYPNAWAPHQHLFVDYLLSIGERQLALHAAKSFMRSVIEGYKNDKEFYEKYDVKTPGYTGAGGEYAPQTGFGWTNGTALSFIYEFGDDLLGGDSHYESYRKVLHRLIKKSHKDSSLLPFVKVVVDLEKKPIPKDEFPVIGK